MSGEPSSFLGPLMFPLNTLGGDTLGGADIFPLNTLGGDEPFLLRGGGATKALTRSGFSAG
jgi:hypothetical protein